MVLRGRDVVGALDGGDDVLEQLRREVVDVAVAHHHEHVLELSGQPQVVEDLLGTPHLDPVAVALTASVLEVQHRELLALGRVRRRNPDERLTLLARDRTVVRQRLDGSGLLRRIGQQRCRFARDEECAPLRFGCDAGRIARVLQDFAVVTRDLVVVQAGLEGPVRRRPVGAAALQSDLRPVVRGPEVALDDHLRHRPDRGFDGGVRHGDPQIAAFLLRDPRVCRAGRRGRHQPGECQDCGRDDRDGSSRSPEPARAPVLGCDLHRFLISCDSTDSGSPRGRLAETGGRTATCAFTT